MQVVQVDIVDTKSFQGICEGLLDVLRVAIDETIRLQVQPDLRSEEDLVAFTSAFEPNMRKATTRVSQATGGICTIHH